MVLSFKIIGQFFWRGMTMNEITMEKIDEVAIIPVGKAFKIHGKDSDGVFVKGREVSLTSFQMSRHLVTQDLFEAVMGYNPSTRGSSIYGTENLMLRPVDKVNWYEAIVFCNKLSVMMKFSPCYKIGDTSDPDNWGEIPTSNNNLWNSVVWNTEATGFRLPTEAEWEFVARGADPKNPTWDYSYAGSTLIDEVAWFKDNSDSDIHQVGLKKPTNSGVYDMSGNVYEWCWDWFGPISAGAETNPSGSASGTNRVRRGGSWLNYARSCIVTYRNCDSPDIIYGNIGFRIVRSTI